MVNLTTYLYKTTRWGELVAGVDMLEEPTEHWHVQQGDQLLFAEGAGEGLLFRGTAVVTEVAKPEPIFDGETWKHVVRIWIADLESIEDPPTLGAMMFSLVRISNFGRPGLHMRHRSIMDSHDVRVIFEGRVHAARSLFFGLLRGLPPDWREYLEYTAYAQRASRQVTGGESQLPVSQLKRVAEALVQPVVDLAADVGELSDTVLRGMNMPRARIMAVGPREKVDGMLADPRGYLDLTTLGRLAGRVPRGKTREWSAVIDQLFGATLEEVREEEENLSWRPHRW